MRSSRSESGIALLDTLLAVVVLTTGVLALATLQTRLLRYGHDTQARSVAAHLAQSALDEFSSLADAGAGGCDFDSLASGQLDDSSACAAALQRAVGHGGRNPLWANGVPFTVDWQVSNVAHGQTVVLKRIAIRVRWPDRLEFAADGNAEIRLDGKLARLPPGAIGPTLPSAVAPTLP